MRKSASSNVRTYDLRIVRPSALSDLTCPDGEVAAHIHIPWLNQEDADPDGSNPSSAKAGTFLRLDTAPLTDPSGVTIAIPAGARLLAIHNPPSGTGRRRYIYIDPEGLIGFTPGAVGNADPIAFWPKARGSLIQAIPCGETVTLIGQRGISWLLHLPDDKYSLLHTLPSAPTPDFTMTPDHLEGYTRMAGAYPSITVEVGFKESEEVDGTAFTGWLTEGQASSVSIIFRRRVFEAVGEGVERYIKDTHRVGLWLLPTRCLTCYGHALPGEAVTVDSGYAHPYAKLEEWSWKSRTLTMKLSFSLRPMRLSASYMMTSSHAAWLTLFPVLCFAVAKETPFSNTPDGKVEVNGYTHLTGEQGRAFRFSSKSAETLLAEANTAGQFRIVRQIDTFANTLRFSNLPYPPESSPVFTPDYHVLLSAKKF